MLAVMETLLPTFLLGLASAASPCLLPLYPGFIGYLAGSGASAQPRGASALLGVAVLAGLLTTMILIGLAVSVLALPLADLLQWSVPLSALVLVALGLALLAGVNPFGRLAGVQVPIVRHPVGRAYLYGLLLGPVALHQPRP